MSDWIQKAIKHKGRVRRYVLRLFGKKALNKDGTLKVTYIKKAKARAEKEGNTSLVRALNLAITLKRMHKKGKKKTRKKRKHRKHRKRKR